MVRKDSSLAMHSMERHQPFDRELVVSKVVLPLSIVMKFSEGKIPITEKAKLRIRDFSFVCAQTGSQVSSNLLSVAADVGFDEYFRTRPVCDYQCLTALSA